MSERDDEVERIVEGLAGDMPDWHVQSCPGVLYRDKIRRAIEAGRELGQAGRLEHHGSIANAIQALREARCDGARAMQERCATEAYRLYTKTNGIGIAAAIRALKPEDV